jgi:uncharacterized protein (TIGR02996 family)
MSHEAFLQAVRANPDDDTPRLVYADWLDDQGDADRAEFIRVQCEVARMDANDPRRPALKDREQAILHANWRRWIDPIRDRFRASIPAEHVRDHYFRRGFIVSLWIDAADFVTHATDLFRRVPFTGVSLRRIAPWAARLAECPWLTGLDSLEFRESYVDPLDPAGARALAQSPHFRRLRMLYLISQNIGDAGLRELMAAPWTAGLTHLVLYDCGLSDEGAVTLAGSANLAALRRLSVHNNQIGERGALAMLRSPHLRRLAHLDLGGCELTWPQYEALRREFPLMAT